MKYKMGAFGAVILVVCGAYVGVSLWIVGCAWYREAKEKYIQSEIIEYLSTHPVVINDSKDKTKPGLPIEQVSKSDLLKMVRVCTGQLNDYRFAFASISDVINEVPK